MKYFLFSSLFFVMLFLGGQKVLATAYAPGDAGSVMASEASPSQMTQGNVQQLTSLMSGLGQGSLSSQQQQELAQDIKDYRQSSQMNAGNSGMGYQAESSSLPLAKGSFSNTARFWHFVVAIITIILIWAVLVMGILGLYKWLKK